MKYLEDIEGTAECFPYDEIQELREAGCKHGSNIHISKSIYCFKQKIYFYSTKMHLFCEHKKTRYTEAIKNIEVSPYAPCPKGSKNKPKM